MNTDLRTGIIPQPLFHSLQCFFVGFHNIKRGDPVAEVADFLKDSFQKVVLFLFKGRHIRLLIVQVCEYKG